MTNGSFNALDEWIKESAGSNFHLSGEWVIANAAAIERKITELELSPDGQAQFDLTGMTNVDTTGAWLLHRLFTMLDRQNIDYSVQHMGANQEALLNLVSRYRQDRHPESSKSRFLTRLVERLGRTFAEVVLIAAEFIEFFGKIVVYLVRALLRPSRFRFHATVNQLEAVGFNAIPIVCLISFLIGVVIAYQGALQLGRFGAEIFTVDLLSVSILRELGILLTAIVIAGRSGSTFAAQIGSMKLNEEIDAMQTIGMDPIEVLVVPRIVALAIALPILTLIADITGLMGGAIMTWVYLDLTPALYLNLLANSVSQWTFWIGIIKAPVFALLIGLVGCYEGFQVESSAESVGRHTTRAVVESIFLVIVFDALFSIFFGIFGI